MPPEVLLLFAGACFACAGAVNFAGGAQATSAAAPRQQRATRQITDTEVGRNGFLVRNRRRHLIAQ